MKLLLKYLKPYKWLVILTLALAGINIGFSLVDPILLGKLVNLAGSFTQSLKLHKPLSASTYFSSFSMKSPGVWLIVILSISVAMISRIAKNFQDYFLNVIIQKFGASVFTDGLQHAMKLPYADFEDQRSGETLSILTQVRADVEKVLCLCLYMQLFILAGVCLLHI